MAILAVSIALSVLAIIVVKTGKKYILPLRKASVAILLVGGAILVLAGILLELAPFIEFYGYKQAIINLHTIIGNIVIGAAIIHAYLNWSAIRQYSFSPKMSFSIY